MADSDVRDCVDRVVAAVAAADRSQATVSRYRRVLEEFAVFLAGRGLASAGEQVCIDFICEQTGVRLGWLREPVAGEYVKEVRRPVVLLAEALAGRAIQVDRTVIEAKDRCPARFRALRDGYLDWCRGRGNAAASVVTKDKAASRFLEYLDLVGVEDLAGLGGAGVVGLLRGPAWTGP